MKWINITALLWLLPTLVQAAVPLCSDVFTSPPTDTTAQQMLPPAGFGVGHDNFDCKSNNNSNHPDCINIGPGDYDYHDSNFENGYFIHTSGPTTRLYFHNMAVKNAVINDKGDPEDLIIYVTHDLKITGNSIINAIVYVGHHSDAGGGPTRVINGAAGGISLHSSITTNVMPNALANADFGGMCSQPAPVVAQIDHFRLSYSNSPLTCKAEPVTIEACKDAGCTALVTDPISVTLTATNAVTGWEGGAGVNLVNGTAQKLLWHTDSTKPVTLGVASSSPSAAQPVQCQQGGTAPSAAACTLTFADAGLLFDVPDKLAGKPVNVTVSAVRKSDHSQKCVPTFQSVSKNLAFWGSHVQPSAAALVGNPKPSVNGIALGSTEAGASMVALNFNVQGEASVQVNYLDAGRLEVNAKYSGGPTEGQLMLYGADSFVSFPVGLCLQPKDAAALCPAADASCAPYKRTGDPFALTISARAWTVDGDSDFCDNPLTANFALADIALSHSLVAPSGGAAGNLSLGKYTHQAKTIANEVSQSVSEVGVFRFSADPSPGYLGSGFYDIPAAFSPPIGRFVPSNFAVTNVSLIEACGSFSYMDQPIALALDLEARNQLNQKTQNYQGSFAKAEAALVAENNDDGQDLSARLAPLAGSWQQGMMSLGVSHSVSFNRTAPPGMDGPFDKLALGLAVDDKDTGLSLLSPLDMKADSSGDCRVPSNQCTALRLGEIHLRHGRVRLDNTYGPENESLRMPAQAEFWNGSRWDTSVDDNCTTAAVALATQVDNAAQGYRFAPALGSGQSLVRTAASSTFAGGSLPLLWRAQGATLYRGQVTAPLDVPAWMRWYWDWDGNNASGLYDPRASAYFGRYRGDDRVIFWRERN